MITEQESKMLSQSVNKSALMRFRIIDQGRSENRTNYDRSLYANLGNEIKNVAK